MGAIELVKDKKTRKTFEPVGDTGTICRDHCFKLGAGDAGDPRHHADLAAADLDQGRHRRMGRAREAGAGPRPPRMSASPEIKCTLNAKGERAGPFFLASRGGRSLRQLQLGHAARGPPQLSPLTHSHYRPHHKSHPLPTMTPNLSHIPIQSARSATARSPARFAQA